MGKNGEVREGEVRERERPRGATPSRCTEWAGEAWTPRAVQHVKGNGMGLKPPLKT